MSENRAYDPLRIVEVLFRCDVEYILIGATAARLQGFPRLTADADITPACNTRNLHKLAAALRELQARIHVPGIPEGLEFVIDEKTLVRADIWNLVTVAGRIAIIFRPLGTDGYDDLKKGAIQFRIGRAEVSAASITDIIRCKRASDRPQDRADIPVLQAILERRS